MAVALSHYGNNGYYKDCSKAKKKIKGLPQTMNEKSESSYGNLKESLISNSYGEDMNENQAQGLNIIARLLKPSK